MQAQIVKVKKSICFKLRAGREKKFATLTSIYTLCAHRFVRNIKINVSFRRCFQLLICTWFLKNGFGKIKLDKLDFECEFHYLRSLQKSISNLISVYKSCSLNLIFLTCPPKIFRSSYGPEWSTASYKAKVRFVVFQCSFLHDFPGFFMASYRKIENYISSICQNNHHRVG